MPRVKKEDGDSEPKKRSRTGCWPCKARKVKCGEEKPVCANCTKNGETCDYSIRLNWGGRSRRDGEFTFVATPESTNAEHVFSSQHIATRPKSSHHEAPTSAPDWSPQPKRMRLSPQMQPLESPSSYFTPSMDSVVNTPGSSINSTSPMPPQPVEDVRRLSVKSLLSDPDDRPLLPRADSKQIYGYDHGSPDLDIPHNHDENALKAKSPQPRRPSAVGLDPKDIAHEFGGYYANPVEVKISTALHLPQELKNPMNLLYFHFFINHTARIMVPHDCPDNPLRSVLPLMAVKNQQLLHLMLAFSASHRARLLDHPQPVNRIAGWMDDVLPALRQALDRPTPDFTDLASLAPLVTAIMLASLEIMSPNTFAVSISWQNHLDVARRLIVSHGGLQRLSVKSDGNRDKAVFLISRWFAYLDVLGSLSGSKHRKPLGDAYFENGGGLWLVNRSDDEIYRIDCFFGFSGRCIALLASIAELAAKCDDLRIDPITKREASWQPSEQVRAKGYEIRQRLIDSVHNASGCVHNDVDGPVYRGPKSGAVKDEILATNEAFHWAGLIHLLRRVLGLPRDHPEVQDSVTKVLDAMERVRKGSTAESCLLFPMFSAGCEALGHRRQILLDRMHAIESWGAKHVARARAVMQRSWEMGLPWEVLVDGEFFG